MMEASRSRGDEACHGAAGSRTEARGMAESERASQQRERQTEHVDREEKLEGWMGRKRKRLELKSANVAWQKRGLCGGFQASKSPEWQVQDGQVVLALAAGATPKWGPPGGKERPSKVSTTGHRSEVALGPHPTRTTVPPSPSSQGTHPPVLIFTPRWPVGGLAERLSMCLCLCLCRTESMRCHLWWL